MLLLEFTKETWENIFLEDDVYIMTNKFVNILKEKVK